MGPLMSRRPAKTHRAKTIVRRRTAARAGTNTLPGRSREGRAPQTGSAPVREPPRRAKQAERRQAILEAALEEFASSGFAATRLEDVARRAGVAKGTIYLHFRDKEALFQELVRAMLSPIVGRIAAADLTDVP